MKTERDGFGYAVDGVDGVYGEKCISDYFSSRLGAKFKNPIKAIKNLYEFFGKKSAPVGAMLLHGRVSTNSSGLKNCHPMIKDDHYLIHNGVVTDHGPDYTKQTTNDSEDLLHRFIQGMKSVEELLSGYYAFTCIGPDGLLHVVRDDQADLSITWCESLDTFILATTEYLLEDIAEELNVSIGPIDEIKDNVYMTFKGNEMLSCEEIEPRGWDYFESMNASKSLGKELTGPNSYQPVDESSNTYYSAGRILKLADKGTETFDGKTSDTKEDWEHYAAEEFKELTKNVDHTDHILDWNNREISASDFHSMQPADQQECWIETADGDVIEYWKYSA